MMNQNGTNQNGNAEAIDALKRTEKMRIEFVANVSHELRTPLTSIKGYAETLLQDLTEGRGADPEFVKIIVKNSNRLLDLIQDLLDLSMIESGVDELSVQELDTEEVSQHAVKHLERFALAKGTEVKIDCKAKVVYADPKRLDQVLTNLVNNAIKYCPAHSIITVKWNSEVSGSKGGNQKWTVLEVIDNGNGIPASHLDRLFERFYRIDKGRSRETGGTGLGLSIVKHILQRHNGTVSVESTVGVGTRFICRFPNS